MFWHERPAVSQLGATFTAVAFGASLLVSTGCKGASDSTAYDSAVLDAYKAYSTAAGWPAHPYVAK